MLNRVLETFRAMLAAASAELEPMGARAQVFVKRAQEKDEDKQMYGPKMVARVLDFWARLEAAVAAAKAENRPRQAVRGRLWTEDELKAWALATHTVERLRARGIYESPRVGPAAESKRKATQRAGELEGELAAVEQHLVETSEFDAQNLANTVWAFATLGQLDKKLFAALARAADRKSVV